MIGTDLVLVVILNLVWYRFAAGIGSEFFFG